MKARFDSKLQLEQIDDCNWLLLHDLVYDSEILDRTIVVPREFKTDLASVPRLPLIYAVAGNLAQAPAVVHDYLYRTPKERVTRAQADAVFREAMQVTGQPWWRRQLMWLGVRVGGWPNFPDRTPQPGGTQ